MELLNELADLDLAPAAMAKVRALFEQQQSKLAQRDAVLAEKEFKIAALTHELAYYRRIRFGKASEALAGEQRLLFDETVDTDLAAIDEELRPRRLPGGNASEPAASRCRRTWSASSTVMNQHRASAANAAPTWSRSAKTSANSWTWNRRASSCIATSVRSMPAALARR
jgi:hypothetical protein